MVSSWSQIRLHRRQSCYKLWSIHFSRRPHCIQVRWSRLVVHKRHCKLDPPAYRRIDCRLQSYNSIAKATDIRASCHQLCLWCPDSWCPSQQKCKTHQDSELFQENRDHRRQSISRSIRNLRRHFELRLGFSRGSRKCRIRHHRLSWYLSGGPKLLGKCSWSNIPMVQSFRYFIPLRSHLWRQSTTLGL